jgi:hypothetical protein
MARTQQTKKKVASAVTPAKTPIAKKTKKATGTTAKKQKAAVAKAVEAKTIDTKATRLDAVTQQSLKAATSLLAFVSKVNEKKNSSEMIEAGPEAIFLSVGLVRVPDNAFKSFKGKRM